MIIENTPITNKFISVPNDRSHLNCAAFVAGVVKGVLDATDFVSFLLLSSTSDRRIVIVLFSTDIAQRKQSL